MLLRPHPNLYILGTVHIGSKSAQDVENVMKIIQPSTMIVEIPPSRCIRIQQKIIQEDWNKEKDNNDGNDDDDNDVQQNLQQPQQSLQTQKPTMDIPSVIGTLPSLVMAGYTKGGISGVIFSIFMVWSTLLKQSSTATMTMMKEDKEEERLVRINEFETAIRIATAQSLMRKRKSMAMTNNKEEKDYYKYKNKNDDDEKDKGQSKKNSDNDNGDDIKIIPADIEFEELIQRIAKNMTFLQWIQLGFSLLQQELGILPKDPIQRKTDMKNYESWKEWETRRRDIKVARASRIHGEEIMSLPLSNVLVNQRDDEFARICIEELMLVSSSCQYDSSDEEDHKEEDDIVAGDKPIIMCVVGLVHVDGIVSRVQSQSLEI